jgi:hypothetical protein
MVFYNLITDAGRKKRFAYGISIEEITYKEKKCSVCGVERNVPVNEAEIDTIALSNDYFPDFLGYYYKPPFNLISEKAKEVFIRENVTAYNLGRINVVSVNDLSEGTKKRLRLEGDAVKLFATNPPMYSVLHALGKAQLHEKSEITVEECKACGNIQLNMDLDHPKYIKNETWDGSDLFLVPYFPALIFCSERFVEIYTKHNLTGLLFTKVGSL